MIEIDVAIKTFRIKLETIDNALPDSTDFHIKTTNINGCIYINAWAVLILTHLNCLCQEKSTHIIMSH